MAKQHPAITTRYKKTTGGDVNISNSMFTSVVIDTLDPFALFKASFVENESRIAVWGTYLACPKICLRDDH